MYVVSDVQTKKLNSRLLLLLPLPPSNKAWKLSDPSRNGCCYIQYYTAVPTPPFSHSWCSSPSGRINSLGRKKERKTFLLPGSHLKSLTLSSSPSSSPFFISDHRRCIPIQFLGGQILLRTSSSSSLFFPLHYCVECCLPT